MTTFKLKPLLQILCEKRSHDTQLGYPTTDFTIYFSREKEDGSEEVHTVASQMLSRFGHQYIVRGTLSYVELIGCWRYDSSWFVQVAE